MARLTGAVLLLAFAGAPIHAALGRCDARVTGERVSAPAGHAAHQHHPQDPAPQETGTCRCVGMACCAAAVSLGAARMSLAAHATQIRAEPQDIRTDDPRSPTRYRLPYPNGPPHRLA